jgi:alpha-beta hydrolase superfamily lysophospholipase
MSAGNVAMSGARRIRRVLLRLALVFGVLLLVVVGLAWSTRRSWAAGMLVLAPNPSGVPCPAPVDVQEHIDVTRGGATIRAWVFEPADAPRGTLLMLHGIRDSKLHLVSGARRHVAHGLRVVAVDSRGHGESSGAYLTYGVEESRDLVALVDELERRKLLQKPLAVLGHSYGAASAIEYAAIDPRVQKVAAISPFASLREVVPAYLDWMFGWPAHLVPSTFVDDLLDGATHQAGFDADRACPRCLAPRILAPVLLVHSRDDERIPWRHSIEIRDALKSPHKLMLVSGASHVQTGAAPGVDDAVQHWLE